MLLLVNLISCCVLRRSHAGGHGGIGVALCDLCVKDEVSVRTWLARWIADMKRTLIALLGSRGGSTLDGLRGLVEGVPMDGQSGARQKGGMSPYLMVSIMNVVSCEGLENWM